MEELFPASSAPRGISTEAPPPSTVNVTDIGTPGATTDSRGLAALIGVIVFVLLLLICLPCALRYWRRYRHKGSYVTNEMDQDDEDEDEDEDEESVGSDAALQSKEALKSKEEE